MRLKFDQIMVDNRYKINESNKFVHSKFSNEKVLLFICM